MLKISNVWIQSQKVEHKKQGVIGLYYRELRAIRNSNAEHYQKIGIHNHRKIRR